VTQGSRDIPPFLTRHIHHAIEYADRSSDDPQGRSILVALVRPDNNLDILPKRDQKTQKPLHGELPEFASQHFRNVGLANSEKAGGVYLFHLSLFHDRIDPEHKLRLDEMLLRVRSLAA
jgi:hypothetical protein